MWRWYEELGRDGRRTFWVCFAGLALDALDANLVALVTPALIRVWHLSRAEAGLLASVGLVSSALGGWLAGLLADRIGRVRTLQLTMGWFALFTGLAGLTQNLDQLLVARALQGIGLGGEWAAGAVLIGEVVLPRNRGRAVGIVQSSWAIGWGTAVALSAIVFASLPQEYAWRVLFLIGLLPGTAVFFVRRNVKESAAYASVRVSSDWTAIFRGKALRATLLGSGIATGMHTGYYAVASWLPTFLADSWKLSVLGSSGYLGVVIVGSFAGYVIGSYLDDHLGRRATLRIYASGALATVFLFTQFRDPGVLTIVLAPALGFFSSGIFSCAGPVLTELFPTEMRGAGQGFCYNVGRGVAGIVPLMVGQASGSMDLASAIGIYACAGYVLVLLVVQVLPETRGSELSALATQDHRRQ